MKILFICRFNRFRSKVAEAIFNKLNKNPKYKAISAGVIRGNPLDKKQVAVAKQLGFTISSKPKGLTSKMLRDSQYHIIVADDVPRDLLKDSVKYGKKLIVWKIPDAKTDNEEEIKRIILEIEKKVEKFVGDLGWN